jgi:nicotinate-nucleotide adenylyltransferase
VRSATGVDEQAVGILGGTFDPPHLAHLAIAEEAREVLGLSTVLFVPAGEPWQKSERRVTPGLRRVEMVKRAIAGNPAFGLDTCEVDRPGPSYTVDTLVAMAAGGGPVDPWLILSAEALSGLATWREPGRILELARLCVVPRGDAPADAVARFRARFTVSDDRFVVLDQPRLGISSTAIRARVQVGRSIRYLVPDGVAALIAEYALYRVEPAPVAAPGDR